MGFKNYTKNINVGAIEAINLYVLTAEHFHL